MTTDNKHKWECISPGEYDTTYRCSKCGALHTDQADDPSSLIPEFRCPVIIDLKSMTVKELLGMQMPDAFAGRHPATSAAFEIADRLRDRENALQAAEDEIFKLRGTALLEIERLQARLEEAQQKIVAQQAVVSNALEAISATHFFDDPKSRMQRARAVLQSDDLSALAAHDAELTAKAKAEALEEAVTEIKAASEERLQFLEECRQEAAKWKAEGDDYGWNFHMGRAAGANWADLFYFRRIRRIKEMAAEYRAKAGRSDGT